MAEMTPEKLSEYLWASGDISFDEASQIATADNLAQAVSAAEALGATLWGSPYFEEVQQGLIDEGSGRPDLGTSQILLATPEGAPDQDSSLEDALAFVGTGFSDEFVENVMGNLDLAFEETDEADKPAEPLPPESAVRFVESGIDPIAHWRDVIDNPDYKPYVGEQYGLSRNDIYGMSGWDTTSTLYQALQQEGPTYLRSQYFPDPQAVGNTLLMWSQLSPKSRSRIEGQLEEAGLLPTLKDGTPAYTPGAMGLEQFAALEQVQAWANTEGQGFEFALLDWQAYGRNQRRIAADNRPAGARRASFSIPASMRQIPDYESIEQEVTNIFRSALGRDVEDWELGVLADQMKSKYQDRNAEMIVAAKANFYQAQGGAVGATEVEVADPRLRAQKFIEERYGPEIDRRSQIEDTSVTNRLMIDAITTGARMVSG